MVDDSFTSEHDRKCKCYKSTNDLKPCRQMNILLLSVSPRLCAALILPQKTKKEMIHLYLLYLLWKFVHLSIFDWFDFALFVNNDVAAVRQDLMRRMMMMMIMTYWWMPQHCSRQRNATFSVISLTSCLGRWGHILLNVHPATCWDSSCSHPQLAHQCRCWLKHMHNSLHHICGGHGTAAPHRMTGKSMSSSG